MIMKKMLIGFCCSLLVLFVSAGQATDPLTGRWKTEDNAIVEIVKTTANTYIIRQVDAEKKSDKQYNGKLIGQDFSRTSDGYTGTLIDPSDNKTYKGKLILSSDGKTIQIKVKWGFISFNEKWVKQ
jgi:uncharacterized protein (DUF2147 family)